MAELNTTGNAVPLAEAIVSVKGDLTQWQNQVKNLKSEIKNIGSMGKELNAFANNFAKYVIAPLTLLGSLGTNKFLQTTNYGAAKLRAEIYKMTWAWNQFLSRVGEAIYKNETLSNIIKGITRFLNNLDTKKINAMIDLAKWSAFAFILMKMPGWMDAFYLSLLKAEALLTRILGGSAMASSLVVGEKEIGKQTGKKALTTTVKQTAKEAAPMVAGGAAASIAGNIAMGGAANKLGQSLLPLSLALKELGKRRLIAEGKTGKTAIEVALSNLSDENKAHWKPIFERKPHLIQHLAVPPVAPIPSQGTGGRTGTPIPPVAPIPSPGTGGRTALPGPPPLPLPAFTLKDLTTKLSLIGTVFMRIVPLLMKLAAIVGIVIAVFEALSGLMEGLGLKFSIFDYLISALTFFSQIIKTVTESIHALFVVIGEFIKNLATLKIFTGKSTWEESKEAWQNLKNIWSGKKDDKFSYMAPSVQTTGLADLNRVAQEAAFQSPMMDNTEATNKNTEATNELIGVMKNGAFSGVISAINPLLILGALKELFNPTAVKNSYAGG